MKKFKLYRVILNFLFYIFYVLLISIAFSFIFPIILTSLGKDVWLGNDSRFINIQFGILILVLVFSSIFRKYFYLPISVNSNIKKIEVKKEKSYTKSIREKKIVREEYKEKVPELDIKIGKEIK